MPDSPLPRVSVVVVNHNRKDLLRACLESLCRQQGVALDVVLVDNGSTDGSAEMARGEFGHRLPLQAVLNADNRGFCEANNQGFALCRAPFVALLNNDAEANALWLAELLAAFENRPQVGMAASKILVHEDPRRIDKVGHLIYWDGQNRGRGCGELDRGQYDQPGEALWPDGCAAMYRRALLEEVGGFDEDLFAYADDAELGLRAQLAGWRCWYAPTAVVRHHRGATLGVRSRRRLELIERNRVLLAAKLFPWSLLWLNGAFYLTRIAAGLWAALRGKGEVGRYPGLDGKATVALALIRGDLEAMRLLPRMLRKRQEVRRFRKLSTPQVWALLRRYRIPLRELTEQSI